MLTIIAFAVTIIGSINWLTIGLLQYDFIAGIFGYQASVFSRIIYIIFGLACAFLIFKLIKGKGTLAVFSRRNKKDLAKNLQKIGQNYDYKKNVEESYALDNVESGREQIYNENYDNFARSSSRNIHDENRIEHHSPRSMFDEHFDDMGDR